MGGYENYRRSIVIRGESVLQFKATHPRQPEIAPVREVMRDRKHAEVGVHEEERAGGVVGLDRRRRLRRHVLRAIPLVVAIADEHVNDRSHQPVAIGRLAMNRPAGAVEDRRSRRCEALGLGHDDVLIRGVALLAAEDRNGHVHDRREDQQRRDAAPQPEALDLHRQKRHHQQRRRLEVVVQDVLHPGDEEDVRESDEGEIENVIGARAPADQLAHDQDDGQTENDAGRIDARRHERRPSQPHAE